MKPLVLRRIVYLTFIAIFIIAAPLIILYTMGYRYNLEKGRVQKTGILKITSVPSGADIFLNGVKYASSQTPTKIEKLLPGDYEIKLFKDGYQTWQKKLPVAENGTTFAEKLILWKKSTAANISSSSVSSWILSPDKNIVALTDNSGNINLLDINSGLFGEVSGGNISTVATVSDKSIKISSFSPSGRYLLANGMTGYYLIDTIQKISQKITSKNFTEIKWDVSADTLYGLDDSGIWQINTSSLKSQLIQAEKSINDFYIAGKNVFTIFGSNLNQQALGSSQPTLIEKLDYSDFKIKTLKNNRIIAISKSGNLAIIDLNRQIKTIEGRSNGLNWLSDSSLIFYNDFEIYIYDFNKDNSELITRLGTPIDSAIWQPQGRHLIFSTDNKIKIIELDNRELRNIIDIADAKANNLSIDRAGNNLYYSVDKKGIFKLNIQ